MRIAEGIDVRLGIFDIETIAGFFDVGVYDPDTGEWFEWEVSEYANTLDNFVKFYKESKRFDFWVSFNGIGFDHQVLEWVCENYQKWYDLDNKQIAQKIADFGSKVIDDQNYNIQPPYSRFSVDVIDLFRIHHFDNEAKRTSLKWCEYMMNMDVEEMPVHHTKVDITKQDRLDIIAYRRHDVLATYELLKVTLGQTDLEELKDYKGKNKIQDRIDVMKETGMECLNWSDVKIGEEWNKQDYIEAENVKDMALLFNRKVKHPFGQPFSNFFPKTMQFSTKKFQDFITGLGKEYVKNMKQEFTLIIGKTTYTIAKGGLHSTEKHRTIIPSEGWYYTDIDVGSQYPNSIYKLKIHAPHLKPSIMDQFFGKIKRRFQYKDKAAELKAAGKKDEARPYSSVQEMLKLCLNGGYYGKLGQPGSFLEYPEGLLKVCMSNQIEILMLIEMMEEEGIQVMSGNTDGITVLYPESKKETFLAICKQWEQKVGNDIMGKLEHTQFSAMFQDAVNSYIAKKIKIDKETGEVSDDGIKKKGKFLTEFELNKNKSQRIIAMALEKYLIEGISPIDFIRGHTNIFDFCAAKKAFGNLHYEELVEGSNPIVHKKLIRYYVSTDGNVIKKRGFDSEGKPMDNYCEAPNTSFPWLPTPKLKYFNRPVHHEDIRDYKIDYDFYIMKVLQRIDKLKGSKMAKEYADQFKAKQTSLF